MTNFFEMSQKEIKYFFSTDFSNKCFIKNDTLEYDKNKSIDY